MTIKNRYSLTEAKLVTPKENGLLTILEEVHAENYKKGDLSHKFSPTIDEERLYNATRDMLPYFPYQDDSVNIAIIQADFPTITEDNFEENADVIDDYYNNSLNYVVANRYNKSKKSLKCNFRKCDS